MACLQRLLQKSRSCHALQILPSLTSFTQLDRIGSNPWLSYQRFSSSSSQDHHHSASSDVDSASSSTTLRPGKYDHEDIYQSAERIFGMDIKAQDNKYGAAYAAAATNTSALPSQLSAKLLEEYEASLAELTKKRGKHPLKSTENLTSWVSKHSDDLKPFLAFLHKHGVDAERTVAMLFLAGPKGRQTMLPGEVEGSYPFEENFQAWEDALNSQEELTLHATTLLQKWQTMLIRRPPDLSATVGVLHAVLPNPEDFNAVLNQGAARVLGQSPLILQNRLLKLLLASEGRLRDLITADPNVLIYPLDSVLANLRLVRQHCRSGREFRSFLMTSAEKVVQPTRRLQTSLEYALLGLLHVFSPFHVDAMQVLLAKPQLLLLHRSKILKRWNYITDVIEDVPEWKDQLDALLTAASSVELTSALSANVDDVVAPPEWASQDLDPRSLGLTSDAVALDAILDSSKQENDQDTEGQDLSPEELKARRAYSALGELLWVKPWKLQRLEYLKESLPEHARDVPFVPALTVKKSQFVQKFPEFEDFVEERRQRRSRRRNDIDAAGGLETDASPTLAS